MADVPSNRCARGGFSISRRSALQSAAAAALLGATTIRSAQANQPLRIAMSLADVPRTWGGPDGGFEGLRFGGYTIFDPLVNWDLSRSDAPSQLVPGLALSWSPDPANGRRWIFKLRTDATFHDGSQFDADAVVWNFRSVFDQAAPQFNATRAGMIRARLPSVVGAEKIDASTVAIETVDVDALLPYQLSFLFMVSPARFAAVGSDWARFNTEPSGTGPFRVVEIVPRERLELARNEAYFDKARLPKAPRLSLRPISDGAARVAALRSGVVDFIESVPPDTIASLRAARFQVVSNAYPHVWVWYFSVLPDSPFRDLRVRQAANLAVDRASIAQLLNGTALPAQGFVQPDSPWFGAPSFRIRFDLAEARRLMAAAGYGPGNPAKAKVMISASGGGQMQPLPMNEVIKANLAEAFIEIDYQVVDFFTLFTNYRNGAKAPPLAGVHALNLALPTQDPTSGFVRTFMSEMGAPRGTNWGHFENAETDAALRAARGAFDKPALDAVMARAHSLLVDQAPALIVVHDTNPRAMAANVRGFVQPRNWFADFTPVEVG
jgi:peptide/nickel transport system substrate-binding protein